MGRALDARIRRRYDRWSRFYDAFDLGGMNSQKRAAIDLMGLQGDERVLDLGTGTGVILPHVSGKLDAGLVIGLDFSRKMLARARGRVTGNHNVELVLADGTGMPFPDCMFDVIVATFAFTSFPDPEGAMRECARVLRPGGKLVVLDTGRPPGKRHGIRYAYLRAVMWLAGYTNISLDVPALMSGAGLKVHRPRRFRGSFAYLAVGLKI